MLFLKYQQEVSDRNLTATERSYRLLKIGEEWIFIVASHESFNIRVYKVNPDLLTGEGGDEEDLIWELEEAGERL